MKTYPYNTPDGIIELVEKREYDELLKLVHDHIATINDLRMKIEIINDYRI